MNQIKFIPLALLTLLVLKQLVHGIDAAGMGVTVALCAIVSLKDYLEKQDYVKQIRDDMKKELEEMKLMNTTQNEVIAKMALALDEVRTKTSTLQLAQGYKTQMGQRA